MDPIGCRVSHPSIIKAHRSGRGTLPDFGLTNRQWQRARPGETALAFRILINLLESAGERDHRRNHRIGLRR